MNTLLIGAAGQVGYELARRLAGPGLTVTTRSGAMPELDAECIALDVGDVHAVRDAIRSKAPQLVINASAYTAVDRAETEAELAFQINADAPKSMADACAEVGARFVHFSTDYVFDGSAHEPYRPDDATSPVGVYGRSKLAGERAVLESAADALIVRTAWVYATRGQNFLRTMLRLASERDQLRVVDDQIGCPTPAWLVAAITDELLERGATAGVYHAVARGEVSWCGFAVAIFEVASERGLVPRAPRVVPIPSSEYPTPARRPAYSVLDTGAVAALGIAVPAWRDALVHTFERDGDAGPAVLG